MRSRSIESQRLGLSGTSARPTAAVIRALAGSRLGPTAPCGSPASPTMPLGESPPPPPPRDNQPNRGVACGRNIGSSHGRDLSGASGQPCDGGPSCRARKTRLPPAAGREWPGSVSRRLVTSDREAAIRSCSISVFHVGKTVPRKATCYQFPHLGTTPSGTRRSPPPRTASSRACRSTRTWRLTRSGRSRLVRSFGDWKVDCAAGRRW